MILKVGTEIRDQNDYIVEIVKIDIELEINKRPLIILHFLSHSSWMPFSSNLEAVQTYFDNRTWKIR